MLSVRLSRMTDADPDLHRERERRREGDREAPRQEEAGDAGEDVARAS